MTTTIVNQNQQKNEFKPGNLVTDDVGNILMVLFSNAVDIPRSDKEEIFIGAFIHVVDETFGYLSPYFKKDRFKPFEGTVTLTSNY